MATIILIVVESIGIIIAIFFLFLLWAFFFAKIDPKEGRDYAKIVHPEGNVHYVIGGIISPMKPGKYTLFQRYILGE